MAFIAICIYMKYNQSYQKRNVVIVVLTFTVAFIGALNQEKNSGKRVPSVLLLLIFFSK